MPQTKFPLVFLFLCGLDFLQDIVLGIVNGFFLRKLEGLIKGIVSTWAKNLFVDALESLKAFNIGDLVVGTLPDQVLGKRYVSVFIAEMQG